MLAHFLTLQREINLIRFCIFIRLLKTLETKNFKQHSVHFPVYNWQDFLKTVCFIRAIQKFLYWVGRILLYLTEFKIPLLLRFTIHFTKKENMLLIKLWYDAFQTQTIRLSNFKVLKLEKYIHLRINEIQALLSSTENIEKDKETFLSNTSRIWTLISRLLYTIQTIKL